MFCVLGDEYGCVPQMGACTVLQESNDFCFRSRRESLLPLCLCTAVKPPNHVDTLAEDLGNGTCAVSARLRSTANERGTGPRAED